MFRRQSSMYSLRQAMVLNGTWIPLIKVLWSAAIVSGMVATWQAKNKVSVGRVNVMLGICSRMILKHVRLAAQQSKVQNFNSGLEKDILEEWGIPSRGSNGFRVQECQCFLPMEHTVKVNTDGATNHHSAGIGLVFRNHNCDFLLVATKNLGSDNSFHA
ncbi:hypothetical protein FRX31_025711 [Thalictrum thalictroides]|uniref:RNase H type-1 domain-containing protein n=1 Tax=Thalictrum thalictroides TaxID=46969 RepID=A0A7J6VIZ5_THATH|nr:hypothetical protein FRX31_025711 [Thalictrum thalictroides]